MQALTVTSQTRFLSDKIRSPSIHQQKSGISPKSWSNPPCLSLVVGLLTHPSSLVLVTIYANAQKQREETVQIKEGRGSLHTSHQRVLNL